MKLSIAPFLAVLVFGTLVPRSPADVVLYASDYGSNLSTFNTTTDSAIIKGTFSPSYFAGGLDTRGNGQLYGISGTLDIINTANAQVTQVGGALPVQMGTLAFSPSDQLFAVSLSGNKFYQLNPDTGAVIGSPVTISGTGGLSVFGIDFAANGTLYGVSGTSLYTVNPSTGAATLVKANIISGTIFLDCDIGPDGLLRAWVNETPPTMVTIDPTTGTLLSTETISGLTTSAGLASAVPEPSSLLLAGAGLSFIFRVVWSARQKRRQDRS